MLSGCQGRLLAIALLGFALPAQAQQEASSSENRSAAPTKVGAPAITLWTTGAALGLASWGLVLRATAADIAQEDLSPSDPGLAREQQVRDRYGVSGSVASSLAAISVITANAFWLPTRERVPWWSWLLGGIGVGGVILSVGPFLLHGDSRETRCGDGPPCTRDAWSAPFGALTLTQGLALISLPLTHLLRRRQERSATTLTVQGGPGRAVLQYSGTF